MKIFTFDTTLRDGTQGESISFSVDDKLIIAQKLDDLDFRVDGELSVLPFGRHVVDVFRSDAKDHVTTDRLGRLAAERRLEEARIGNDLAVRSGHFRREEVHRRRADEPRHE